MNLADGETTSFCLRTGDAIWRSTTDGTIKWFYSVFTNSGFLTVFTLTYSRSKRLS